MSALLVTVMIFLRTDCPISNSYAPEIERIAERFAREGVRFELVFPDAALKPRDIEQYRAAYSLTPPAVADVRHEISKNAHVRTTPEAAVFRNGRLVYHGRIDNRYAALGKARPRATEHNLEQVLETLLSGREPAFVYRPAIGCAIGDLP